MFKLKKIVYNQISFGMFPFIFFLTHPASSNPEKLPKSTIEIDADKVIGKLEPFRHSFGQGGVNPIPLPQGVIEGIKKLQPRLIRIFLQEFFNIYSEDGKLNWQILDPYMEALAQTGAKIVACITIKPRRLFPQIDQRIWQPKDVKEWQNLIYELVKRYSVEKQIVTYWEVANEPDIGEAGGTPYLIPEPAEYCEFYRITTEPIIKACPTVKVGGPALASVNSPLLEGLIEYCKRTGTKLDFVSWHLYSDDPTLHAKGIERAKSLLRDFPGKRPEMLITEWNRNIGDISGESKDASVVASCLLSMLETDVDWTFYYQICDQVFYKEHFEYWFSAEGIRNMENFWNPVPRFGLFDLEGRVRAPYFVYQMLYRMGEKKIDAKCDESDIKLLASRSDSRLSLMFVNPSSQGKALTINIKNLKPGKKSLRIYSIDANKRWSSQKLELLPIKEREIFTSSEFSFEIWAPSYSVIQAIFDDIS
ncbi:hypothetical protein H5T87_01465 [bacterium]|nr:hypothetical protein [bacterium]